MAQRATMPAAGMLDASQAGGQSAAA
jgi:hypothetical protein